MLGWAGDVLFVLSWVLGRKKFKVEMETLQVEHGCGL